MIGDVYYVTTKYDKARYGDTISLVNHEVLQQLDNTPYNVNFHLYDNWHFQVNGSPYIHSYCPYDPLTGTGGDGKVDQIFIMWRDYCPKNSSKGGESSLSTDYTTRDGMQIYSDNGTTQYEIYYKGDATSNNNAAIMFPAHEYCHYLFGTTNGDLGSHFDGRTYNNHSTNTGNLAGLFLMTRSYNQNMSVYERYRLGWLNPTFINNNTTNVVLSDSRKYNTAIMIPLRYDASGYLREYYMLENLQTTNSYSEANPFNILVVFDHTYTKGLVDYHILNENLDWPTMSDIDEECADGLWQWGLTAGASTPGDRRDDVLDKITPTYNYGNDEKDYICLTVGGIYYNDYLALRPEGSKDTNSGWRYKANDAQGKNEDFFNSDYADVFSKWSNPSTCLNDHTTQSYKGFQITGYNSSTHSYTLNIGVDSATTSAFKPSKPQNLKITVNSPSATLTWAPSTEPNVKNGGSYKIYRVSVSSTASEPSNSSYTLLTTVPAYSGGNPVTSYTDEQFWMGGGNFKMYYEITAVDNASQESTRSNSTWAYTTLQPYKKNVGKEVANAITEYKLSENYPNPFNPSTVINYQIPTSGKVTLKVYDVLGKEIATLVNENKEAGSYNVNFNASNLPSGVYVYKIESGSFIKSQKMMLVK